VLMATSVGKLGSGTKNPPSFKRGSVNIVLIYKFNIRYVNVQSEAKIVLSKFAHVFGVSLFDTHRQNNKHTSMIA
jgi:hypothetical protein